jgi:hypothetical protein
MTIGATWPHRSGGIGVMDIFAPPPVHSHFCSTPGTSVRQPGGLENDPGRGREPGVTTPEHQQRPGRPDLGVRTSRCERFFITSRVRDRRGPVREEPVRKPYNLPESRRKGESEGGVSSISSTRTYCPPFHRPKKRPLPKGPQVTQYKGQGQPLMYPAPTVGSGIRRSSAWT